MLTPLDLLLKHLDILSYHITGAIQFVESPLDCYDTLKDQREFSKISEEEKIEDNKIANKFRSIKPHLQKSSREFIKYQKLIKANIQIL